MSTVTYKTLLIGVVLIFLVMGGAYTVISSQVDSLEDDMDVPIVAIDPAEYEREDETYDDDSVSSTSSDDAEEFTDSEVVTPITQTPSAPAVPADVASTPTVPVYTLSQITEHSTKESCWTAIRGKVYDLTPYVSRHPGGERNILKLCGKEGTELFADQHGGDTKPESRLASLYIGMLVE